MAAVLSALAPLNDRASPSTPPLRSLNTSNRGTPAPVPSKHIPVCSPGPRPEYGLKTPPRTPPQKDSVLEPSSLLDPPTSYGTVQGSSPPVYSITAAQLAEAVDHIATQPLPDTKHVFPWLHGLHADNQVQLAFFLARKRSQNRTPQCIRGIAIVKAGGDLTKSKLKSAIGPDEIMLPLDDPQSAGSLMDANPKDGFSVRNFQIQAAKMATVSDIVVYQDAQSGKDEAVKLAKAIATAQEAWKQKQNEDGNESSSFHTFLLTDDFATFERDHEELVAIDSEGTIRDKVFDFFMWERKEMCEMSKVSEFSQNVFLGPSPDPAQLANSCGPKPFDVYIECTDLAHLPTMTSLNTMAQALKSPQSPSIHLDFASSGSILTPNWSQFEVDGLMDMCHWIYLLSHGDEDSHQDDEHDPDGDSIMSVAGSNHSADFPSNKKILLHCGDGYTETSLLALAYFMYAEGLPVHEAWIRLHCDKKRDFFAYQTDVALLTAIQPRILQESPKFKDQSISTSELVSSPHWMNRMDGSLPSRVLPYMYLGNLNHANNPHLLREMGITQILSVGEPLNWTHATGNRNVDWWPRQNLLYIDRVQDNGVDPLTNEFPRCLSFIAKGRAAGGATLVHCRVGVSRSATICIAEVMRERQLSFPRAYTYVRARRLNVIIQPHLRFTYELLKWEEEVATTNGRDIKRELEWASVAREIARMNRAYARA